MKRLLPLTITTILLPATLLAEEVSPEEGSWWDLIMYAVRDAFIRIAEWTSEAFGWVLDLLFDCLPTDLQTDISPYMDYIQILNAWVPISEACYAFMAYLTFTATYTGIRWCVRMVRGA